MRQQAKEDALGGTKDAAASQQNKRKRKKRKGAACMHLGVRQRRRQAAQELQPQGGAGPRALAGQARPHRRQEGPQAAPRQQCCGWYGHAGRRHGLVHSGRVCRRCCAAAAGSRACSDYSNKPIKAAAPAAAAAAAPPKMPANVKARKGRK